MTQLKTKLRSQVAPISSSRALLRRRKQSVRQTDSLEALIGAVAKWFGTSRAQMHSRSHSRYLTCARALVTWHATRSGIATLQDVARALNRNCSTLTTALDRYSVEWGAVFDQSLEALVPHSTLPRRASRRNADLVRRAA